MKTIVCIKQVPSVSELKFDNEKKTLIREGVHNEINPFDRRAITFAVQTKKSYGGEVVAMTMGPPQAKDALVEAMAMGADRSLHLLDKAFAGSDTFATAQALTLAIRREMPIDLVLCGKYSVDAETGHIGPEIAELASIPHVSGATKVEFMGKPDQVLVESETDFGFQRIEAHLPTLITTAERLVKPYAPTQEELEFAKTKSYRVLHASDLSSNDSLFGLKGSPTSVSEIYSIESRRQCQLIQGTAVEQTRKLAHILVELGLFTEWKDRGEKKTVVPDSRTMTSAKTFWVVADLAKNKIRGVTYELLGRGLELASKLGSELCTVILGNPPLKAEMQSLFAYGADKVYVARIAALEGYSSDGYAAALAQAVEKFKPFAVIAGSTSFGRDFMPRVAARLSLGMTSDCIGLDLNEKGELVQLKPAFGGNIVAPIVSRTTPQIATIRPGMLTRAEPNQSHLGETVEVEIANVKALSRVVEERVHTDFDSTRLDNAEVIVAAGAGIGGPGNFQSIHDLARILDAPIATTRKVVDLGWLPSQLQIGLTGRSIAPRLYIAVAVRGAFNHMVGVGRAKTIVAINKDPNALIFKSCDYGIVGDYAEIVPLLTKELKDIRVKTHTR